MKRAFSLLLCAAMLTLTACGGQSTPQPGEQTGPAAQPGENTAQSWEGASVIELSDGEIAVTVAEFTTKVASLSPDQVVDCGNTQSGDPVVTVSKDIVYYEDGHDFTYGEGTQADAHTAEEAQAHTVVTIRQPGTYVLRGQISAGQVAVDLGDEAEDDPNAVVTLVLDGVDITCTVAPAIIFYNVYECGSDDADTATKDVDTSAAGANVIIADGTENNINGSYVARIYKPGTVELSEDGAEVEDAKKLHKYDAAFYSKMSMNVSGESGDSGVLRINAENEGLDSELHLTINGGTIDIKSGNDGINTNEDGVSVTTINGGNVCIQVTGETGEGDGIDSNGWLVINGGTVVASACSNSADAGIDSDMGIHIGAGATVMATGHMLDRIEGAEQNYAVFQFGSVQSGEDVVSLRNADGAEIMALWPQNDYSVLIYSAPELTAGDYTLWSDEVQLGHSGVQTGGMGGFAGGGGRPGGMMPGGMQMPEDFDPDNMPELPEGFAPANMERPEMAQRPENGEMPERMEPPEGFDPDNMPEMPEGMEPPQGGFGGGRGPGGMNGGANATEGTFSIQARENYFSGVGTLSE